MSRGSRPATTRSGPAASRTPPTRSPTWPPANPGAVLHTIVGDDAAAKIRTWERVDEVLALSRMVVVDRPGNQVELDASIDWIRVEVPHLEVSSTDLRERCVDGRPLDYLVTDPVLDVIRARGLYGVEVPA